MGVDYSDGLQWKNSGLAWLTRCGLTLAILLWLSGGMVWAETLRATAIYRERIALPPDAVFEAELQEISKTGVPVAVLGRARLDPAGQPPFGFGITYAAAVVRPERRYAVCATIVHQGRLLFTTDRLWPVLHGGEEPLQIMLVSAGGAGDLPAASGLVGPSVLTGLFVYVDGIATITLCADGQRLPVAMEGDFKALETAFLQANPRPEQPRRVSLEGMITPLPTTGEGPEARRQLLVKCFIAVWPFDTCDDFAAGLPLGGIYWRLVRLGDQPVAATPKQREAHLVFDCAALRVAGSGGCNRISGAVRLDGDKLRFDHMALTMMACPDNMELEAQFLEALGNAVRYRIGGNRLELLDEKGVEIVGFEADTQR